MTKESDMLKMRADEFMTEVEKVDGYCLGAVGTSDHGTSFTFCHGDGVMALALLASMIDSASDMLDMSTTELCMKMAQLLNKD